MTTHHDPATLALRSVHTDNFPAILRELGISLVVSTYQSGKLILVREDGGTLNTHFKELSKPMGVAVDAGRIAVGTGYQLLELRNVPAVCEKLVPPHKHDACYLARCGYITGDIDIHEMAYAANALWLINTRFSCLCTADGVHSFVPRWRPPFVSAYDLTDRCHLNGLGVRDSRPRYVTALGETDSPEGWRADKARGGILMDIEADAVVCRGLSMPHSPRWHAGNLWVLESGRGTLARVNEATGACETIAELPGFTRGLDFHGPLAFVGLSQVRETAVFAGIPVTERVQERNCGVWVVNLETRETLAFLRFEESVHEIFAVAVLPGVRFPELIISDENLLGSVYALPDEALAEVAKQPPPTEPDSADPEALIAMGDAAYEKRQLDEAADCYERCLARDPENLTALYNLSVTDVDRERWVEAREHLARLLEFDPGHARAHNNLGIVDQRCLKTQNAIGHFRRAISLQPDFADAHFNLGIALLQTEQFEEGFEACEWRWKTGRFTPFDCPQPRWDGAEDREKRILVHTEQDICDAVQFIRYLPLVAERCRQVIVVCPSDLMPLFETVEGISELRAPDAVSLDGFDAHISLLSLPWVFGTTLDTIPARVPYLRQPEGRDARRWFEEDGPDVLPTFGEDDRRLRVGFAWASSRTNGNDRNRSCELAEFFTLLRTRGVVFFSLQKPVSEVERAQLVALGARDLSPHLKDYADTAAAIARLDLLIGVDTPVIHLAGAMAKPVWTLLGYCPDGRWMLDRNDTPWYPTMRLYRQPQAKQWRDVMAHVRTDLEARVLDDGFP
jgi:uncharacterized protein (TIGR03032 family)